MANIKVTKNINLQKKLQSIVKEFIEIVKGVFSIKAHNSGITEEHRTNLKEKFQHIAEVFGKAATKSNHSVPKEQQISIDLGNKKFFDIIDKVLYWIQDRLKNIFPRFGFFPEFTEDKRIIGTNVKVKHFTPTEQAENALYVGQEGEESRLYDVTGKLYDTTGKISKGQKDSVAYAMTLDGMLVVHEHLDVGRCGEYAYRHSTLGGGKAILCSGLIKIKNGKIEHIDNNSGHYKPTSANLYNAIKKLNSGVFVENAKVTCLTYGGRLKKEVSLTRKLPAKGRSIEKFLNKMEKTDKNGQSKHKKHFTQVRRSNEKYKLRVYIPALISDYNNNNAIKIGIEHSIRKIIGANYGHKPEIKLRYDKNEISDIGITFRDKEDRGKLIEILKLRKLDYISYTTEHTYETIMNLNQADKFIKKVLKINIDMEKVTSALINLQPLNKGTERPMIAA